MISRARAALPSLRGGLRRVLPALRALADEDGNPLASRVAPGLRSGAAPLPSAPLLKGRALRRRKAFIEKFRLSVQGLSLAIVLWIGIDFVRWAHALQQGIARDGRPPGVEGFLPISALISLRHLFLTGEWSRVHPAGLAILLLAILNALLLKRSFCSWICPIGTISESLATIGGSLFRRRLRLPRALDLPLRGLKYLLLAFFLFAVFVQMAPHEVERFLNSPYNKVADIKMMEFFAHLSPLAMEVLLGLLVLSIVVPYFWCRYLCPYGALLGCVSSASPMKIRREPVSCIDCGLCTRACPTGIKVDQAHTVHSDECFGCLSCVAACPVPRALQFEGPRHLRIRPALFALLVVGLFFGGIGLARTLHGWRNNISPEEYRHRIQEINDPKYTHARGRVPEYRPGD